MNPLFNLGWTFLKLGCISFGGPVAHIALMEQELVHRKKWLSHEHFLDLLGITQLIPGPNSTEMAIHLGYVRAGVAGLLIAGLCFLFPSVLLTGLCAWVYTLYGTLPFFEAVLLGIQPTVLIIIATVLLRFGKKTLKTSLKAMVCGGVMLMAFLGINEVIALVAGALLYALFDTTLHTKTRTMFLFIPMIASPLVTEKTTAGLSELFLVFVKAGAVLFGSGYVLFAYLEGDLVHGYGWLTSQQLLDAIAVGQLTPGPVLATATFIGFQCAGWQGAILATVAIFAPAFLYVGIISPFIPRLKKVPFFNSFLQGAQAGALALIAVVLVRLSLETLVTPTSWIIAAGALMTILFRPKLNPVWFIVGGAVFGYLFYIGGNTCPWIAP